MGFLSNIFKRNDQSSAGSISISKEELEEVIVCALLKAEEKRQEKEALKAKQDSLTDSVKWIMRTVLLTIAAILFLIFVSTVLSFLFLSLDMFESFRQLSSLTRGFVVLVSGVYCVAIVYLYKGVKRETDRSFLISYFSAITSVVSLIVALCSTTK